MLISLFTHTPIVQTPQGLCTTIEMKMAMLLLRMIDIPLRSEITFLELSTPDPDVIFIFLRVLTTPRIEDPFDL